MGIAIIKGELGAYATTRSIQNVTPKDSTRRKLFVNGDLSNVAWELIDGVYRVTYVDVG